MSKQEGPILKLARQRWGGLLQLALGSVAVVSSLATELPKPEQLGAYGGFVGIALLALGAANAIGGGLRMGRGFGYDLPTVPQFVKKAFKAEEADIAAFDQHIESGQNPLDPFSN